MSEHDEQCAVIAWARLNETQYPELALLFAVPNGLRTSPRQAVKAKQEGLKRGVPDLCLPVARGGWHGLFIELKHGRNRPSDAQVEWLDALTKQGYLAVACWEFEEATETIAEYLKGGKND